ncbi:hypothetical protein VZT92_027849 [Zoarces viviparus]|uniref:Uncharacterized protein n=1 Tax=Zoarces viviparus TaxID=48416 RepID=A0AAW1DXD9_ZOAVI
MDRRNPDWWVWSARPPPCLLSQHSGSLVMLREEEEEEEAGEHRAACCCSTGYHDQSVGQAADARWSTSQPPIVSRIPSSSGPAGRGPGAPPSLQPETAMGAGGGHLAGGRCWEGPRMETQGCVCVCGQREAGGLGPCWPGSPYVYGVRRNLVVGVEVVEEVAVEDTLEVITEDVYTDDLLDAELLQDAQMYPT